MPSTSFLGTETQDGWEAWLERSYNVAADAGRIVLDRERHPTYTTPSVVVEPPTGTVFRDVAIDDCGVLVLLAADGTLWTHVGRRCDPQQLRCLETARWEDPTAVCATENSLYVADGSGRVFALARAIRQLRWVVNDGLDSPIRIVPAREGPEFADGTNEIDGDENGDGDTVESNGETDDTDSEAAAPKRERPLAHADTVYVLDTMANTSGTGDEETGGVVFRLDPDGTVTEVVRGLADPTDIAFDSRGLLYVLDHDTSGNAAVRVYDATRRADDNDNDDGDDNGDGGSDGDDDDDDGGSELFEEITDRNRTAATPLSRLAVMPTGDIVAGVAPGATTEQTLSRLPASSATFEPLPSFNRGVTRLVFDVRPTPGTQPSTRAVRGLYAVDGETSVVYRLEVKRANRLNVISEQYDALAVHRFDAGEQGVQWHRITSAFDVDDSEAQLRIHYHATDDERLQLRHGSSAWRSIGPPNPADALLDDAVGRYLWVALELVGGAFVSPQVRSVRVYFPRDTYLRHLPTVYREDAESRAFLERFLSVFESVFDDIEAEFTAFTRYLDSQGVPDEYLSWLEGWLAVETGPQWPEAARREFLASAPELFKARGTRRGLVTMLDMYLDHVAPAPPKLRAAQRRELDRLDEEVAAGDLSAAEATRTKQRVLSHATVLEHRDLTCLPPGEAWEPYERFFGCSQCFFVIVRSHLSDAEFDVVRDIVEASRPAHTVGRAVRLQPWAELGGHAYLGVNTTLPRRELVVGRSTLGRDTELDDREPSGQLDIRGRLGEDSLVS